ncbi:two-component regulator propeller domain-containing protein [Flavivirga amylovorans]|uniref:histidine kinase n=1 Tax=Flavivirga amylovorans TaxID=870486 RepID=A0ABT8WZM2_9FLAO|nr:hybrid sensor histidine kinase/response regulator transcription factor [Flavivirga amylovorans]MDO5987087.1 two-component regulator propeller domain-containing protein [Flavivirga amylovorans]
MQKKEYTIFFLFIFSFVLSFAQNEAYQFKHISTLDGLSQSSVMAIHQDRLGQIWIGTREGLNKYDGNSFKVYKTDQDNKNSICNNDILCIYEDSEGFIWIGTHNGLSKYNPQNDTFKTYLYNNKTNSLSNNTIRSIQEVSNGDIWIGTADGISIYNKTKDTFTRVFNDPNKENSLCNNDIFKIYKTPNNDIWIGTTKGLSKFVNRTNNSFNFENYTYIEHENIPFSVNDLIENENKELLIATSANGMLYINPLEKKVSRYLSQKSILNNDVRQLAFDTNGALWICTYKGVNILNKDNSFITLTSDIGNPKSLSKNSVKSIFKDNKGSMWLGTYHGGLNIWDKTNANFTNFTPKSNKNMLSYDVVSSIERYNDLLLFGTEGGGITAFNSKTQENSYITIQNNKNLPENNIKSLLVSGNTLWIGTLKKGLTVLDITPNGFKLNNTVSSLKKHLLSKGIYAIKEDHNNNIWIGTFGNGLIKYNKASKVYQIYKHNPKDKNTLSSNFIRTITLDSKNNIWVGTLKGVSLIKDSQEIERFFYDEEVKSGDDISCVFEGKNKQIWVGTKSKGLFKFQDNTFKSIPLSPKGNKIYAVHSILEDDKENLWISTNQGIVKYGITTKTQKLYNQTDGLISNEFNDGASLKVGNSKFYFGGFSGVVSFDSNTLSTNTYAPQVLITDLKVKNKSVPVGENNILKKSITYTKNIILSHKEGIFSIDFAIPNFINQKNNSYQYRLIGLEDAWTYTSQNTASFTIQNPGDYIFEVKGANNDGVWNKEPSRLKVRVKPAPWFSWWALLLYVALISIALILLDKILKSKARLEHQLDLEHLENERKEEVNKAKLEFFTNVSHEFRTPLTLILGPLHQILEDYKGSSVMYKKLLVIENSAKHLLHLINRLMDFRKFEKNVYKLETAEGNVVKFMKEIYLSFSEYAKDGDYDYSFHTTEEEILVYYDRYKLERVFYNLISNAFRYTPKNGKIAVRIKKEKNSVVFSVEDTGIGISADYKDKIFERFFEVKLNNNPDKNYNAGTGIGLSIAKNIVAFHHGKIWLKNNKNDKGSIFYVELPLGRNHLSDDEIIKDFKFSDDVSQYVTQLKTQNVIYESELKDDVVFEDKPTILLVEDNKPLRAFMKNVLIKDYNILEAENGKIGLSIVSKHLPNLIVSDVVMPVMAGTELCSEVKGDIKTSHIPIILLTSRSSLVYKLEGLQKGADDYISKPFNISEFKLRIKNLLENSARLKQKFSGTETLLPDEMVISSLDEKLYKKALKIIENNISNNDFNIHFFCSELGVSRTLLFIKIKAWTNFTPNEFIQHFRMKRAAQLLEQGKMNISEVSYEVGFKNPKYFSKCFHKKFGTTPTQFQNKFSDILN